MKTQREQIALPLRVGYTEYTGDVSAIFDAEDWLVASAPFHAGREKSTAYALGIVQAVNAHEKLVEALRVCQGALHDLSEHPAFADDAPEFNRGGIGYVASQTARAAIAKAKKGE